MPYTCRWAICLLAALVGILVVPVSATLAQVEAISGQPFGVAEVRIDYPPDDLQGMPNSIAFSVTSPDRRVVYPAFEGFRKRLRYLGGSSARPIDRDVLVPRRQTRST